MCGIAGFITLEGGPLPAGAKAWLESMNSSLAHRGPDAAGTWLDLEAGVAFGHRRLSILDLSTCGAQPMLSHCGRYVLSYNGEIYNTKELRAELEKKTGASIAWRGHSDTEIFLEACAAFGVKEAVMRSIGMFAFALWDKKEHRLTLSRDRFGVKPLYYACQNGYLLFASELKALKRHPAFKNSIDRNAVAALLKYCFIPEPLSIYEGVYKLRSGHLLQVARGQTLKENAYFSAFDVAVAGVENRIDNHAAALEEMHQLLREAVAMRMAADVPLGAFLSGGVDSSLIVALMQEASAKPVRTFSIGFEEKAYNEAHHALAVAKHLGTEHTELYVTPEEAMAVICKLPAMYDEPFADSSQIPTYLVSALARQHVTIALSGDGGDELFGGYPRHVRAIEGRGEAYHEICMSHWQNCCPVLGGNLPPHEFGSRRVDAAFNNDVELRQYLDTTHYLNADILVKVDRASMAVSLEVRPPLLDHRVYALAWRMPPELRRAKGIAKWPLRYALDKYVPSKLIDRPKMGFGIPLEDWLRGPLRDWAEALLDPTRLREEGYLDAQVVGEQWKLHLAGKNRHYWLWDALMFQAWLEEEKRQPAL